MKYLIIGAGKIAKHLKHYLSEKASADLSLLSWDRSQELALLKPLVEDATHILLAISDSALQDFYREHLAGHGKVVVHFSGAVFFDGAICAHPLMSFGPALYPLATYEQIHFTLTGCEKLSDALPGLTNFFAILPAEQKPFYHAMCVVGGNFPVVLWQKMFTEFARLGIPAEAAGVYLHTVLSNTLTEPLTALTGPLARKDEGTITKNLKALEGDDFQDVYRAFVKAVAPDILEKLNGRPS